MDQNTSVRTRKSVEKLQHQAIENQVKETGKRMMFGGSIHAPFTMQHNLEQLGTTLNSGVPSLGQKQNIGLCVQHSGLPRNSFLSCLTWSTDSLAPEFGSH